MGETYNPEEFAKLVKKAIGGRKQKDFAAEAGISAAHLNLLVNGKTQKVPSSRTIEKIAKCSEGRVTNRELLLATLGVSSQLREANFEVPTLESVPKKDEIIEKKLCGLILTSFSELSCKATPIPDYYPVTTGFVTCKIENASIDLWQFRYLSLINAETGTSYNSSDLLYIIRNDIGYVAMTNYYDLLCWDNKTQGLITDIKDLAVFGEHITSNTPKISYVVTDEISFQAIAYYCKPLSLDLLMSVILVDLDNFKIIKEQYLQTRIDSSRFVTDKTVTFCI